MHGKRGILAGKKESKYENKLLCPAKEMQFWIKWIPNSTIELNLCICYQTETTDLKSLDGSWDHISPAFFNQV